MIICLGPVCVPIWHLLPVLLYLFTKSKTWVYWLCGWEIPEEEEKKEKTDEDFDETQPLLGGDAADDASGLRKRKGGAAGVTKIESVDQWQQLQKESEAEGTPLVVDFTATWCKPCKKMAPFFEDLSRKYEKGRFVCVDVTEMDDIAAEAKAHSLPTFQIYRGTKMVKSMTGAYEKDLEQMVKAEC
mmetsp:Transcript_34742/g.71683  ORF Transcript_34742/g.71683 Transcript_34742/m.71683 type:complete len:186 (+) Transcript_34742:34-591(+)